MCPVYYLSAFLGEILKPITQNSPFNIKNSFELKDKLSKLTIKNDDTLVSFDIVSLFTNIPIDVAKEAINERWNEVVDGNNIPIKKDEFFEALDICLIDNNFFKFNNMFYKQKSGLAMGNPMSPILADIVLEKLLREKLAQLNFEITFICKYVDDILLIIPEKCIDEVKYAFESFHPKIKFTVEKENNKQITYLDMRLKRYNNKINTEWYSKEIASNRMLNFISSHPYNMKRNVALSFIKRVFYLTDSESRFKIKRTITNILIKNNYPPKLIDQLINKTLYSYKQPQSKNSNEQSTVKIIGSLPYIPRLSEKIKKSLSNNSNNILIANKIINSASSTYTKLKDKISNNDKSGVVYSIPCECGKQYVGETGKTMNVRVNQHAADIRSSLKPANIHKTTYRTALVKHAKENHHKFQFDQAVVLDYETNRSKRWFKEACHIWKVKNTVNYKTDSNRLKENYSSIINNFYNR